jgi:hypothetical protein
MESSQIFVLIQVDCQRKISILSLVVGCCCKTITLSGICSNDFVGCVGKRRKKVVHLFSRASCNNQTVQVSSRDLGSVTFTTQTKRMNVTSQSLYRKNCTNVTQRNETKRYQTLPNATKRYQKQPNVTKRYQTKRNQTKRNATKVFQEF